jgi:hypothetical protein
LTAGELRTLAFGSLEGSPWGAAWSASAAPVVALVGVPALSPVVVTGAGLDGAGSDGQWCLRGEGVDLAVTPQSEPVRFTESDDFEQLCRVSGRAMLDGEEREVSCLGRRAERTVFDLRDFDSVRDVAAWFEPDDGIGLVALRPRRGRGHERDSITAAVLDSAGAAVVADPRLSTTYDDRGAPLRAGLELWMDGDEATQYPRRAAGESLGAGADAELDGLVLRAELLRWHSRGREGAGVYLLARRP